MAKEVKKEKVKNSIYDYKEPRVAKRFAAWIVDLILVVVLATGFAFLISLCYGYDSYNNKIEEKYIEYGLKVEDTSTPGNYIYCDFAKDVECQNQWDICRKDPEFIDAYVKRQNGMMIILFGSITASLLVFEFILPICLKHGRTIGMRFFGIGYITDEGIEPSIKSIFVRFLFGKLILEGLVPGFSIFYIINGNGFGLVGLIALILIFGANGYLLFIHSDRKGIHDYIARMIPVDNDNQIYIKTTEELAFLKAKEANPNI